MLQGDRDGRASRLLRGRDRRRRARCVRRVGSRRRRRRWSCSRRAWRRATGWRWRSPATRRRSRGSSSRTWRGWWSSARTTPASAERARRPTVWTPARWPSCWPPASWMRCGCPMSGRERCAGGSRGAASSCARARARRTRSTRCLIRRLQGRPPVTDVFGVRGRRWLAELELPDDERETIAGCLRHVDFLDAEIAALDQAIAREALRVSSGAAADDGSRRQRDHREHVHRGDRRHPPLPERPQAGRLPRAGPARSPVRARPGASRPHHQAGLSLGPSRARRGCVDHGPRARADARVLRARPRAPRRAGRRRRHRTQARQPVLVPADPRAGLRLRAAIADPPASSASSSSPPAPRRARAQVRPGDGRATSSVRDAERALALQAEDAYRRTIADWKATRPAKTGASVTPGRASQRPSKGKAARQTTSP